MIKQAGYKDTVQEYSYEPDTIHSEPWLTRATPLSNHKKTWLNLLYRIIASLTVFILRASLELAIVQHRDFRTGGADGSCGRIVVESGPGQQETGPGRQVVECKVV